MRTWKGLLLAFILSFGTAGLGGAVTDLGPWYQNLQQPAWKPPDWAFGPIWLVILALATFAAAEAWTAAPDASVRIHVLIALAVNSVLNIGWNLFFFKLRRPDWAVFEVILLWLSILALVILFAGISTHASLMLLPYLVWVSIASLLNLRIVQLNRPFSGAEA
jgi:tryptophan-rich sensory protein